MKTAGCMRIPDALGDAHRPSVHNDTDGSLAMERALASQ